MDYFIMSQDMRIDNVVQPIGIPKSLNENREELPIQFEIKENNIIEYVDLIENSVYLVSDELKSILSKYDKKIFFKPVVLLNKKELKNKVYWMMIPRNIECLSQNSEFNKDGTIKKIVIDKEKIGNYKIFKIQGIKESIIVVRLDIAESLLRRNFLGISLKKIEKEN